MRIAWMMVGLGACGDEDTKPEGADLSCMETGWVKDAVSRATQGQTTHSTTNEVVTGEPLAAVRVECSVADNDTTMDDSPTRPYSPFAVCSRSGAHVGHTDGTQYPSSCAG